MNTNYLLKGVRLDSNRVAKVVIFDENFNIYQVVKDELKLEDIVVI